MTRCVDPFMEGQSAWRYGVLGFFTRLRGILLSALLMIATMGAPWWWPSALPPTFSLSVTPSVVIVIAAAIGTVIVTTGFLYLRRRTIRSLDIKAHLHDYAHYLRDHQSKLFRHASAQKAAPDREELALEGFSEHMDHICEHTKDYFVMMTHDSTVNAAIRLAVEVAPVAGGQPQVVYRTVGRSSGLSRARAQTTEDIPASRGIPRYLIEQHESRGVLRYNDLQEAANTSTFHPTRNETLYPGEVSTMLVAPINGWDGKKHSMLGILYVTSKNHNVFERKHIDCMRFVTDMIAPSMAFTVQQIKSSGAVKELRRQP